MTPVVVTGYASLDYVVRLDRAPAPDETATVVSRPREWPRLGGSPAYVASALVAGGVVKARPITWVGDDDDGRQYRQALAQRSIDAEGVAARPGRTPVCILSYQPDGGCFCFYDPGLARPLALQPRQRELVAAADWICLTIGPPEATREILAAAQPGARLVWAVKADPKAMPDDLAAAVAARADIVAYSRREADFVERALSAGRGAPANQWRLETRGADGVTLTRGGRSETFAVDPIDAEDFTGAGDTFVGGFLASLITNGDAKTAVAAGVGAARDMLIGRRAAKEA